MSKESKVPEDLNFYTLKTVLDLTFSRVQFQTDPQSEKVRFGVEVPIKAMLKFLFLIKHTPIVNCELID